MPHETKSNHGDHHAARANYVLISSDNEPRVFFNRLNMSALRLALRPRFWWVLLGAVAGLTLSAAYAFLVAVPIYSAETLIAPREPNISSGSGGLGQQFGGLASLAGINLNFKGASAAERVATLSSRTVARDVVQKDDLLPILFSGGRGKLFGILQRQPPTLDDTVDYFMRSVRHISVDDKTGLVTVAVRWRDPVLAAKWANDLVLATNRKLQTAAIAEASANIEFLKNESSRATLDSLRQAIVSLLEANLNQKMSASVQANYAFKQIDPAEPPQPNQFVSPQIVVILPSGFILGAIVASGFILWPHRRSLITAPVRDRDA